MPLPQQEPIEILFDANAFQKFYRHGDAAEFRLLNFLKKSGWKLTGTVDEIEKQFYREVSGIDMDDMVHRFVNANMATWKAIS